MSLILRSLLRDSRPLTRALRRLDDDLLLEDWPLRKIRRTLPAYESPVSVMEDVSRHMADTVNRMQTLVEELESLGEVADHFDENINPKRRRRDNDIVDVRRTENGGLQLALDVSSFKPEDLKIKLIDDNLVVEAQSESSGKDSYSRSHFKRWFKVPEDCKLEDVRSKITEDNKLLIDLPLVRPIPSNERTIPIEVEKSQTLGDGQKNKGSAEQSEKNKHT